MLIIKKEYLEATIHTQKLGRVVIADIDLKRAKFYVKNGLSHIFEVKSVKKNKKK